MQKLGAIIVGIVFLTSAVTNQLFATVIANAVCEKTLSCGDASVACLGTGSCTYCLGTQLVNTCKLCQGCSGCASQLSTTCGDEYSGTCLGNQCTGSVFVDHACEKPKC